MRCRTWPAILLLLMPWLAPAVSTPQTSPHARALDQHERQVSNSLTRASQFLEVPHSTFSQACEDIQPPQALTTPDPLFTPFARAKKVKVSFIIGTDGRVHSPLILESAGLAGDRHVLRTVRSWRYRPATCNGVPTESEGKIEFSSR